MKAITSYEMSFDSYADAICAKSPRAKMTTFFHVDLLPARFGTENNDLAFRDILSGRSLFVAFTVFGTRESVYRLLTF